MRPGLGELGQIGCIFPYKNPCSYIYSSICHERGPKQQHSWIQEQLKTLSVCNTQKNYDSLSNNYNDCDQYTM